VQPLTELTRAPSEGLHLQVPRKPVHILLVSASDEDRIQLVQILGRSRWKVDRVNTCHEADQFLRGRLPDLVICDYGLLDGDWTSVREMVAVRVPAPPLVVMTTRGDSQIWFDAWHHGAQGVVIKPFDDDAVQAAVEGAWEKRRPRV